MDERRQASPIVQRRRWLTSLAALASASVASCSQRVAAQPTAPDSVTTPPPAPPRPAAASTPVEVRALPFDPARLEGLSERLLVSHHDNNYAGAVRKLNSVEQRIDGLGPDTPGYVLGALQSKRLAFENSVILHEAYFDNLGGNGQLGPNLSQALASEFGSMTAWQSRFEAVGKSLGGGSGWALLTYHLQRRKLSIDIATDHTQTCANSVVLLALDMYEHSYHMDYGTQAARYIEAFMRNVDGEVVEQRFNRALAMTNVDS